MPNFLKRLRKARGVTLKQLSQESGFGVSTINNFENGRTGVSPEFLAEMARILKVSVEEIVGAGGSVSARVREDPPDDAGRAAAFELVFEKMPLIDLMNQIMGLVNDRTETRAQSIETVEPLLQILQRRLEKLE